jgi:DNA-binding response OmpR family regulator
MSASASRSGTGGRSPAGLRALVVDDEPPLVTIVSKYLEREGFEVASAGDGEKAVALAREFDPDVIVLDLMLPRIDGIEACRQIRSFSDAYIVMLTARVEEIDRIVGLSTGADDYVTKPFSSRELVARIRAVLRRTSADPKGVGAPRPPEILRIGDIELDPATRTVKHDGQPVDLTSVEFNLLEVLLREAGRVVTREELVSAVLSRKFSPFDRSIDMHVSKVRKKLGDLNGDAEHIKTVRGVGYIFARPREKVKSGSR